MKKYWISDILTWSRLLGFSALMVVLAYLPTPLWAGLVVYVIGVISDIDGHFARKYPYPNDGKHRWWRKKRFVFFLDEAADVVFGICALVFFIVRINAVAGWLFLGLALGIGVAGQLVLYTGLLKQRQTLLDSLILAKRYLYFALIGIILILITLEAFPDNYAIIVIGIYCGIAAFLFVSKTVNLDRLTRGSKE